MLHNVIDEIYANALYFPSKHAFTFERVIPKPELFLSVVGELFRLSNFRKKIGENKPLSTSEVLKNII